MEQKLFKLCIIEVFLENKGKGKDENGHEKGGSSHNLWEEAKNPTLIMNWFGIWIKVFFLSEMYSYPTIAANTIQCYPGNN